MTERKMSGDNGFLQGQKKKNLLIHIFALQPGVCLDDPDGSLPSQHIL